jgi:hypothetical protein
VRPARRASAIRRGDGGNGRSSAMRANANVAP